MHACMLSGQLTEHFHAHNMFQTSNWYLVMMCTKTGQLLDSTYQGVMNIHVHSTLACVIISQSLHTLTVILTQRTQEK